MRSERKLLTRQVIAMNLIRKKIFLQIHNILVKHSITFQSSYTHTISIFPQSYPFLHDDLTESWHLMSDSSSMMLWHSET